MKPFKNKIKELVYNGHLALAKYYAINFKSIFNYYSSQFFIKQSNGIHLNFLITSNAEVRLFKPIILSILNNTEFTSNILYLNNFKFDVYTESKILQSNNIEISRSVYSVIKSFKSANYLNVICLDHSKYYKQHWSGVDIIKYIRKQGGKTICVQHGGTQQDNIEGHKSSESQYQIVFGHYIYSRLLASGLEKEALFLTGNPMHDDLNNNDTFKNRKMLLGNNLANNKKVITLITCLHTEYDNRENPEQCYIDYISRVYKSIDFSKYHLIVKMHPNDSLEPNIYRNQLSQFGINEQDILIIEPNDSFSVYDYIILSDLIISRSSTVMEESLLLKKKIIAFDLFKNGPSNYYNHLTKYPSYKTVIGDNTDLAKEIEESIINYNFEEEDHNQIVEDFTYRLDNGSVNRILEVFKTLSKR